MSAAKFDKTLKSPRQQLLKDSMDQDVVPESSYWAKELLTVEPDNLDAHYVLAAEALDSRTPNVPEARRHLQVLDQRKASTVRRLWIKAKLADATGDQQAVDADVAQARKIDAARRCRLCRPPGEAAVDRDVLRREARSGATRRPDPELARSKSSCCAGLTARTDARRSRCGTCSSRHRGP